MPDFLGLRALAGIALLIYNLLLDTAYMQDPTSRLFLVGFAYLVILLALILGGAPYLLRDAINWLFKKHFRVKLFAYALCLYGTLLCYVALNY